MSKSTKETMNQWDVPVPHMEMTPEAQDYLLKAAKWAKFMAIVYFILIGLMAVAGIFMLFGARTFAVSKMTHYGPMLPYGSMMYASLGVMYLVMAVIYFFPTWYIYQFATRTIDALSLRDTQSLTGAFEAQKKAYKYIGILFIIFLALIVIGLIAAIIGAVAGAMP